MIYRLHQVSCGHPRESGHQALHLELWVLLMWVWLSAPWEMHVRCDPGRSHLTQSLLPLELGLPRVSVGLAHLGRNSRCAGEAPGGFALRDHHAPGAVVLCTEVHEQGLILRGIQRP